MTDPERPAVPYDSRIAGSELEPDEPEVQPQVRPRRTARGFALAGARVAAGAIGVGIAVFAILIAALAPIPSVDSTPVSLTVTPVPTAQQLVCGGSLLRLGNTSGEDATIATTLGIPTVRYDSTAGKATRRGLEKSSGSPAVISVTPDADATGTALVAGAQSQVLRSSDFSGLAAVDCSAARADTWLVGGSTTLGRTTLITLANPSDVASTVALQFFGDTGRISAPGSTGIVVPAGGQRVLSLAGFAPEQASPVVHVTSKGGQVVARLQQSISRGLEPGGVDITGATAAPATSVIIPGFVVTGSAAVESRLGREGYSDLRTVLRVFVPGKKSTNVTLTVTPENKKGTGASVEVLLKAGEVNDVPIEGLDDGHYTATVDSDLPIVAGLRLSTAASSRLGVGTTDFAWMAAAEPIDRESVFSVATGPRAELHLANPNPTVSVVTLTGPSGTELVTKVFGGTAKTLELPTGNTFTIDTTSSIAATITYYGGGQFAGYPVREPQGTSGPITIYPQG